MKFSDGFYAISNLRKKRLRVRYMPDPCSLTDKITDYLQTICDPMVGFFSVGVGAIHRGNGAFGQCSHRKRLLPPATTELTL